MSDKPKILGVTGGAVALSGLALALGACCVAPWAVGLLGVGGAVMLARLAGLQSPVVALTFLLMGLGFWYAYRARSAAKGETCPVATRSGKQSMRALDQGLPRHQELVPRRPQVLLQRVE